MTRWIARGVCLLALCSVTTATAAPRQWTRTELLAIADQVATKLDYDVEHMGVFLDFNNAHWNAFLQSRKASGGLPDLEVKLHEREYVSVYYIPAKMQLGGDLWVFIDLKTGDVIDTLRGK